MKTKLLAFPLLAIAFAPANAFEQGLYEKAFCSSDTEKNTITEFVSEKRPGKPLAVAARTLDIFEGKIAAALPNTLAVGTVGTPERFKDIWASIEKWGAKTKVGLYVSTNKLHTFSFPSYVPISLPDDGSGMQDIYADDGKGIHSHIVRADVKGIFAARLPADEGFTRTVSFYDSRGDLIIGVIAGESNGKGEKAAINGFEETWELIDSLPDMCGAH